MVLNTACIYRDGIWYYKRDETGDFIAQKSKEITKSTMTVANSSLRAWFYSSVSYGQWGGGCF